MSQQDDFAENNWEAMKSAMEKDGPEAATTFVMGFEDALERRKLFFFGHQAFNHREWQGKNLDKVAEFTQAGIDEMLRHSDAAQDPELKDRYKNLGNIMSYNLSANMADCWPGDNKPREERHFLVGLAAANNCLRWREELKGEPSHFSMAWWARGMHELSLGDPKSALTSFTRSKDFAVRAAEREGHETSISPQGHWSVLLGEGYVAIAKGALEDPEAVERLSTCYAALREGCKVQPDHAGDLGFCLDQLRRVEDKYMPRKP